MTNSTSADAPSGGAWRNRMIAMRRVAILVLLQTNKQMNEDTPNHLPRKYHKRYKDLGAKNSLSMWFMHRTKFNFIS